MIHVIAEPCVATCDQACVDACPVDAIHGPISREQIEAIPLAERSAKLQALQLFIDPEACIYCAACEPECPVSAIFDEDSLPPEWAHYREKNAQYFKSRPGSSTAARAGRDGCGS